MKFGSSFSSSPSILLNYKYLVYISVGKGGGGGGGGSSSTKRYEQGGRKIYGDSVCGYSLFIPCLLIATKHTIYLVATKANLIT